MVITFTLVCLLIVVFGLLILFFNTIDKRKWLTITISFLLTPLVYFYLIYPFINIVSSYHHQKYFDSELWKTEPGLRYEMIDQIISKDTLMGLHKTEITKQLGPFEWLGTTDSNTPDSNKWHYSLGIEPGAFNDKKELLEIYFNNDSVTKVTPYKETLKFNNEDK